MRRVMNRWDQQEGPTERSQSWWRVRGQPAACLLPWPGKQRALLLSWLLLVYAEDKRKRWEPYWPDTHTKPPASQHTNMHFTRI